MGKKEWLQQEPPVDYVARNDEFGRDYIPIGFIEKLLDELCEDDNPWSTENFFFEITRVDMFYIANGRVDLIVHYDGKTRKVSGAKTSIVSSKDDNKDFAGSILSHCLSSAAMKLGNKFGRSLNGRMDITKAVIQQKDEISSRPKPDMIILKKYTNAIKNGDEKTINEIESSYNMNTQEAIKIANIKK